LVMPLHEAWQYGHPHRCMFLNSKKLVGSVWRISLWKCSGEWWKDHGEHVDNPCCRLFSHYFICFNFLLLEGSKVNTSWQPWWIFLSLHRLWDHCFMYYTNSCQSIFFCWCIMTNVSFFY
jgi:hypothetical protein